MVGCTGLVTTARYLVSAANILAASRADKLSPFKFYQHLLSNVADVEAGKFLRMLTFLPLDEIEQIEAEAQQQVWMQASSPT